MEAALLCQPCGEHQLQVKATRRVGKTLMCETHARQAMGLPTLKVQKEAKGESTMERKPLDPEKIKAIRADGKNGMSVEQIRKKHGVSWYVAKNLVAANGTRKGSVRKGSAPAGYQNLLADLRERRDQLSSAIAVIENLSRA